MANQNEINIINEIASWSGCTKMTASEALGQAAGIESSRILRFDLIDGEWELTEEIQCRSERRALSGLYKIHAQLEQDEAWLMA